MKIAKYGHELIEICNEKNIPIYEYAINLEMENAELSREKVIEKMRKNLEAMRDAANEGREKEVFSVTGLIGGDAYKLQKYLESGNSLTGDVMIQAMSMAL